MNDKISVKALLQREFDSNLAKQLVSKGESLSSLKRKSLQATQGFEVSPRR